ncbi:hypothetical protein N665_0579s0001 [Sinapis alba]|nr:hypothetical protein N665_0778s0003 [Sinapis alba]KAF8087535.1 hypothetical protein N665_0579s0001 [Sinapis alba]
MDDNEGEQNVVNAATARQQPQSRPLKTYDTPHAFYQNRSAIQLPSVQGQDYEIKPQIIALVKQHMFHGLLSESPMEHIENLEEICSTTRSSGVPYDYLCCKLFAFSLSDKALRWLKSLPAGSITTWDQCRAIFLDSFYTKSKTAILRSKITNFQQPTSEPMNEAWERFKEYLRDCPHHGYSKEHILNIFYNGVNWNTKNSLNAASNGDFMTKTQEEAYTLIGNLASSSSNHCLEYDRTGRNNSVEAQKIDELNTKIDMLIQRDQRVVNSCEDAEEGALFQAFGNSVSVVQESKLEMMMQQLIDNQKKAASDVSMKFDNISQKVNTMYQDLNNRLESLSAHVDKLDTQVAQNTEAIKRLQQVPLGRDKSNLREQCNMVLTGKKNQEEHVYVESPPYIPKVPYPMPPRHLMDSISAEKLAGFNKMVRRLPKGISFEDAREIRPLHMFFKNCRETQEEIKALFTEALTEPAPLRVLPKVEDPGKFVFPCSIAGFEFNESLCDSGSSVNIMSKAVAEKLGIDRIQPSKMTLAFANSSTTTPYGTIYELPVQVRGCLVHVDFQIVEMVEDSVIPLVLGRPFMATVGAIIDLPNKRVSFINIDKKVFYKAIPTKRVQRHESCVTVNVPEKELSGIKEVKEVLDGDPQLSAMKTCKQLSAKANVKSERIKVGHMTLVPLKFDGDSVEYDVTCKGTSKPFSKVRVFLTYEFKKKGQNDMKDLLNGFLELSMSNCVTCFGTSSSTQPG